MSQGSSPAENAAKASPAEPKGFQNPALRMLGLPRLRAKLPGRNWLIFWGVLATFSGTVYYDRRQKKIIQQKWCNAVSHLSAQPLASNALPRRITVYLSAPPGDSLRPVREHFQEYIKPILLAAGVDWEAVEGRKEGDVRAALAERIRKRRRKAANESIEEDEDVIEEIRAGLGVQIADNRGGDLILGRHTWKEYVRGLHEGWLGPTRQPSAEEGAADNKKAGTMYSLANGDKVAEARLPLDSSLSNTSPDMASTGQVAAEGETINEEQTTNSQAEGEQSEENKTPPKPSPTPPYITPAGYSQSLAVELPSEFPISSVISNPHLLGFLKTPIRLARFLNRRQLAEDQGREVVDLLLTTNPRNYERSDKWEQTMLLQSEEKDYHKSARAPNPEGEESKERPWTEDMVIDDRIGSRMRRPESAPIDSSVRGHLLAWKGGADPMERMSWWNWLKWAFDMDSPEPRCKGWEDGLKGEDDS